MGDDGGADPGGCAARRDVDDWLDIQRADTEVGAAAALVPGPVGVRYGWGRIGFPTAVVSSPVGRGWRLVVQRRLGRSRALTEGGNKMRQFLLNKDNAFKPDEEMAVLENYLTDPSAPAMTALEQIILNTEKTYETYGKQIEEAAKNEEALRKARIAKLRIPGSTACPAISAMYKHASTNRNCAIDNEKQKLEDIKKERADLKKEAEIVAETVTEPVAEPADKPKSGFFSNLFKKNDANATKKGGRSTKKLRRRRNRTNRKR